MKLRDKRGLEIKVGDTLVAGCGQDVEFLEVVGIDEMQVRCSGTNAPVILAEDMDGNPQTIWQPYKYISVCACYRDARGEK